MSGLPVDLDKSARLRQFNTVNVLQVPTACQDYVPRTYPVHLGGLGGVVTLTGASIELAAN